MSIYLQSLLLSTLLIPAALVQASERGDEAPVGRVVGPLQVWTAESLADFDPSWLHLKFAEGVEVELTAAQAASGATFTGARPRAMEQVNRVLATATTLRRTFPGDPMKFAAWKVNGEAASGQPGPDLSLWYDVEIEGGRAGLAATINALNKLGIVEIAHPAPICEPAVAMSPKPTPTVWLEGGTPDFTAMQGYLYNTPVGMDAPSAWATAGGRGAGMKFIDVELGWTHMHEDFDGSMQFYQGALNSTDAGFIAHGTAVMGEVVGTANTFGVDGFASDTRWGTVGIALGDWPIVPHSFMEAAEALDPGDVWLIELQMFPAGRGATPMEYLQVNYDVIWTSSWSLGVVCVEAGANGAQNLDDASWGGLFDRNVRDSGAIMVGAGTPTGRVAEGFTNYGSRMDVHGWGSSITTTGYGDLYNEGPRETHYTAGFSGTSGASPMIVGSGLCLQGIARSQSGSPLTPVALRQLLNETGIAHLGARLIGPRPDLGSAIARLIGDSATLTDVTRTLGVYVSGGVPQLLDSDDSYYVLQSGPGFSPAEPHPARADFGFDTGGVIASTLDIVVEEKANIGGPVAVVLVRNWNTGQWDEMGRHALSPTDQRFAESGIGTVNYINGANRVEVRVRSFAILILDPTVRGIFSHDLVGVRTHQ